MTPERLEKLWPSAKEILHKLGVNAEHLELISKQVNPNGHKVYAFMEGFQNPPTPLLVFSLHDTIIRIRVFEDSQGINTGNEIEIFVALESIQIKNLFAPLQNGLPQREKEGLGISYPIDKGELLDLILKEKDGELTPQKKLVLSKLLT